MTWRLLRALSPTEPVMYEELSICAILTFLANSAIASTPNQRTTLPAQGRATINRSQIPVSVRHETGYASQNIGPSLRYGTTFDGHHRVGATTPRRYGMLGGIKVGRAGTSGTPSTEPRFSRPGGF